MVSVFFGDRDITVTEGRRGRMWIFLGMQKLSLTAESTQEHGTTVPPVPLEQPFLGLKHDGEVASTVVSVFFGDRDITVTEGRRGRMWIFLGMHKPTLTAESTQEHGVTVPPVSFEHSSLAL